MVSNAAAQARENARRSDGKFGVQQRAESGLTLSLQPEDEDILQSLNLMPLSPISTYTELKSGAGRLQFRKYIAGRDGENAECTENYYTDNGQILSRVYSDLDSNLVSSARIFKSVTWHHNGTIRSVSYAPSERYLKDYLRGGNDFFHSSREYGEDGKLEDIASWKIDSNGELYISQSFLDGDGNVESIKNTGSDGYSDPPDDMPSSEYYFPNGKVKKQVWHKDLSLHREGGPAIIVYNPDGSVKAEKYYLEGEEVSPPTI